MQTCCHSVARLLSAVEVHHFWPENITATRQEKIFQPY
jgi:hypothetical protein